MSDLRPQLSVIVLTYNEERNLRGCLESLDCLQHELFVVDSGSTDRTPEIVKEYGGVFVQHPFENYASQRNWAQQALRLPGEWVLHLDADERLTRALAAEINEVLEGQGCNVAGFLLRKRTVFRGRWIRHGGHYPSYHLRLFRLHAGRCEDRLYDQHFQVAGRVSTLRNDYIDVVASDLETWTQRHLRWARLEAGELHRGAAGNGRVAPRLFGTPIERRRWLRDRVYARAPLFVRPFGYWVYRYFLRLGFLDGKQGFIFHFLHAFWFRLMVDVYLDELRQGQPQTLSPSASIPTASRPTPRSA